MRRPRHSAARRNDLATGKLFIDTGAFLARAIAADMHHASAVATWDALATSAVRLYSSEHVFDEALTLIGRRVGYPYAAQWGSVHLASKQIHWLFAAREDLHEALRLMQKFADQSISFTDCLSFHFMRQMKITRAFTFDRHFRLAGFGVIPS